MNFERLQMHQQLADELIHIIPGGVKVKNGLYNARCPVCGDSKKDKSKKRFFIYQKSDSNDVLKCYCHNQGPYCPNGEWITTFAKKHYSYIYERYIPEYIDNESAQNNINRINDLVSNKNENVVHSITSHFEKKTIEYPAQIFDMVRLDLAMESNPKHNIVEYALMRKLPINQFKRLYVTNDFKSSMSNIPAFKQNVSKLYDNTQALIMPMFDQNRKITGFQGRFLNDNFRFLTLMIEGKDKFFGVETLDMNQVHYVLEAPLDSLHVNNAIATLDSNLGKSKVLGNKFVYVFDNQPRSPEICNSMKNIIELNHEIVIFENGNKYKDINDMVRGGYLSNEQMNSYLEQNTYKSDYAIDKFYEWKKINIA